MSRSEIAAEARRWLGRPFRDEGRSWGGIDCVGLVVMVARACEQVPSDFDVTGYPREPDGTLLRRMRQAGLIVLPVGCAPTGSVVVFSYGRGLRGPRHVGIVTNGPRRLIVHASNALGRVVETSLDGVGAVHGARLVRAFDFPALEGVPENG